MPARMATTTDSSSGCEMKSVSCWLGTVLADTTSASTSSWVSAQAPTAPAAKMITSVCRPANVRRQFAADERQARLGDREVVRAERHRADDQQQLVLDDPDGGDHRGDHQQQDVHPREAPGLVHVVDDLGPHHGLVIGVLLGTPREDLLGGLDGDVEALGRPAWATRSSNWSTERRGTSARIRSPPDTRLASAMTEISAADASVRRSSTRRSVLVGGQVMRRRGMSALTLGTARSPVRDHATGTTTSRLQRLQFAGNSGLAPRRSNPPEAGWQ